MHYSIICSLRYRNDYCSIKYRRKSSSASRHLLKIFPLRIATYHWSRVQRLQERSFLLCMQQHPPISLFVLARLRLEENSVNCGFMSVDHDGHLSLQFTLYQPSLCFLRAEHAAAFSLQFRIDESHFYSREQILPRDCEPFCRVCRDIAKLDFPDFPRPQIQPFSDDDRRLLRDRRNIDPRCHCFCIVACNYSIIPFTFVVGYCYRLSAEIWLKAASSITRNLRNLFCQFKIS